jgi:hypothetical protein
MYFSQSFLLHTSLKSDSGLRSLTEKICSEYLVLQKKEKMEYENVLHILTHSIMNVGAPHSLM